MTLADAEVGQWIVIVGYDDDHALSERLVPLGLAPGDSARVVRRGPLGGALLVEAGGRSIAVGRSVARKILVETSTRPAVDTRQAEAVDRDTRPDQGQQGEPGCDSHS